MRCISFLPNYLWCTPQGIQERADGWVVDTLILNCKGKMADRVRDSFLRPIRPSDDEDEMIRIAGKPVKETA